MPAYYLQTLGANSYAQDWDFSRFIPDAVIINLGTNDFGHDSGPAWEANFTATYTAFVMNLTTIHYASKPPTVFLAQGPMNNSPALTNALQAVITQTVPQGVKAYFLDMRGAATDGCDGHPGPIGHQQMFNMAQPQIAKVMGW